MQTVTLVLLSLFVALLVVVDAKKTFSNGDLLRELELELEIEEELQALSRARRSSQCGKHIVRFVMGNCPDGCTTDSNVNLATKCCATQCSDAFIKNACCPS